MSWKIDARVPVALLETPALPPGGGYALLAEAEPPEGLPAGTPLVLFTPDEGAAHPAACTCCQGQGAVPAALATLFRDRAMGGPWFDRVIALPRTPRGRAMIEDAMTRDILTVARFRPA